MLEMYLSQVLLTNDPHYLDRVPVNSIIDTVSAANTAAISWPEVINGRIELRLIRDQLETIEKCRIIFVGFFNTIIPNAPLMDSD